MVEVALSCIGLHATVGSQYRTARRRGHRAAAAAAGAGRRTASAHAARRGVDYAPGGHRAGREGGGRRHAGNNGSEAEHFAEGTGFWKQPQSLDPDSHIKRVGSASGINFCRKLFCP